MIEVGARGNVQCGLSKIVIFGWTALSALICAPVSCLLALPAGAAVMPGAAAFKKGVAEYGHNNFVAAASCFNSALVQDHNNPVYHYYFANALAKTARGQEAMREYQIAERLTHDPTLRSYCQAALQAFGAGFGRLDSSYAQGAQANRPADPNEVNHAISQIDKESTVESMRINSSDAAATQMITDANLRAQQVQQQAAQEANQMANAKVYTRHGTVYLYSPSEVQAVRDQGQANANTIQRNAQHEADSLRQAAMEHAQAMSDAALSLESQLQDQAQGSGQSQGIHLVPNGTNLFVRNYSAPPSQPPAPMVAYPQALSGPAAQSALKADGGRLNAPGNRYSSEKKVHGTLIHR